MGMLDNGGQGRQTKLRTAQENRRKAKHDNVSLTLLNFLFSLDAKDLKMPCKGKSDM